MSGSRRVSTYWVLLLAVALGLSVVVAASLGPTGFRWPWPLTDAVVSLRAPRVLLAAVVGGCLAVSGSAMQVLLGNDLADPYVLGLSGGASTAAVACLWLLPGVSPGPAAALGAAGAAVLVRALVGRSRQPGQLLLAGIAVGSILGSATGLLVTLVPSDQLLRSSTYWLFGGLGTPNWQSSLVPGLVLLVCGTLLLRRGERLDRLRLGAEVAVSLGVDVRQTRRWVMIGAVLLTGGAVASAGLVGFVGLMAPHMGRLLVGPRYRLLVPVSALLGGCIVVIADVMARSLFAPREVPVGLLTAALGGPFFLIQLRRAARVQGGET